MHSIQVEAGLAGVAAGAEAESLEPELEGVDAAGVAGVEAVPPLSVDEAAGVAVAPPPSALPPSGFPPLDLP